MRMGNKFGGDFYLFSSASSPSLSSSAAGSSSADSGSSG